MKRLVTLALAGSFAGFIRLLGKESPPALQDNTLSFSEVKNQLKLVQLPAEASVTISEAVTYIYFVPLYRIIARTVVDRALLRRHKHGFTLTRWPRPKTFATKKIVCLLHIVIWLCILCFPLETEQPN